MKLVGVPVGGVDEVVLGTVVNVDDGKVVVEFVVWLCFTLLVVPGDVPVERITVPELCGYFLVFESPVDPFVALTKGIVP